MPSRAPLLTRVLEPNRKPDALPEARGVVLPELIGGLAGAPLELARWFHRFFFDQAELVTKGRGLLVLQDVVVGRPSPLMREIQVWGSTLDASDLLRMSKDEIGHEFGLDPNQRTALCTEATLYVGARRSWPFMGDTDLERRSMVGLLISTTSTLASVAPYVRIRDGVVWAYRPSNLLSLIARTQ